MRDLEYTNTFMGINTYSNFHPFLIGRKFRIEIRIVNSLKIHHRLILMKIILKFSKISNFRWILKVLMDSGEYPSIIVPCYFTSGFEVHVKLF